MASKPSIVRNQKNLDFQVKMAVNHPISHPPDPHERPGQMESPSVISSASYLSVSETIATGLKTSLSHWKIILFGQIMAMLMGARGSSNALLYLECDVMAPTFQMSIVYAILSLHLLHLYFTQSMDHSRVQRAKEQSDVWSDDKSSVADGIAQGHTRSKATHRKISHGNGGDESKQASAQTSTPSPIIDMSMLFSSQTTSNEDGADGDLAAMTGQYRLPLINSSLVLNAPWYKYFCIALLDVEGNFFTYVALKYTSIKSVALLDTLAIPAAMMSSYMILKRRYSPAHLFGVAVCLLGASMMVFSDYEEAEEESDLQGSGNGDGPDPATQYAMIGDILAALGGICFGIKDTLSEEVLKASKDSNGDNAPSKNAAQTEFLGMLGMYGLIISAVQVTVLERRLVYELFTSSSCPPSATYGMLFCIVLIFVAFYVGMARFLHASEAALLNLNLLTSDLYAVLFSIVEEHTLPTHLFIVSMVLILGGVLVYESVPPPREDVHRQHRPSAYGIRAYNNTDKKNGGSSSSRGSDLESSQVEMARRSGTTATPSGISPSSFQMT